MPTEKKAKAEDTILHEIERLKRSIIHAERAGSEPSRQIAFLYRVADRFSKRVFATSFCHSLALDSGCSTGRCCKCAPDVFEYEKRVLALLPKRLDQSGYCPFFNLSKHNCGIYGVRPFACRIYYNFGASAHYCDNPNDRTLQLFDGVKRHLERVLGPYAGGFRP